MPYKQTQTFGGNGGIDFSDDLTQVCRLSKVIIRHGVRVDAITSVWMMTNGTELQGSRHGGNGGIEDFFVLAKGEYINRIDGRAGATIDSLTFFTNLEHQYGPYGGTGGEEFKMRNLNIGGFFGRAGTLVDQLGCYTIADAECK